jgi:hypothetical protein
MLGHQRIRFAGESCVTSESVLLVNSVSLSNQFSLMNSESLTNEFLLANFMSPANQFSLTNSVIEFLSEMTKMLVTTSLYDYVICGTLECEHVYS